MKFAGQMNNNDALLNSIVHLMETDNSSDAPAASILWTKNLFRSRVVEPRKSLVQRIVAVLNIDLAPNKAIFGERSASSSATRQMLFSAGDCSIDLRVGQRESGFTMSGQILGDDFSGATIRLSGGQADFSVTASAMSEFKFENIEKGTYTLFLINTKQEIVIENINIG